MQKDTSDHLLRREYPIVRAPLLVHNDSNKNPILVQQFSLLATQIADELNNSQTKAERAKHNFRLKAIRAAINIFEGYPEPILSGSQVRDIPGIGVKIAARIDEVIRTGRLAEIKERDPNDIVMEELSVIKGIGPVTARRLVTEHNITGIADLLNRWNAGQITVTRDIALSLTHHEDLLAEGGAQGTAFHKKRIPRSEIIELERIFKDVVINELDPDFTVDVCGSFRRLQQDSGDIDVLITYPEDEDEQGAIINGQVVEVKSLLKQLLTLLKAKGFEFDSINDTEKTKFSAVILIPGYTLFRRFDLRILPNKSRATGLLYFTGSGGFNQWMRAFASSRNFLLNEYGLYRDDQLIPTSTEEEIFNIIGIEYVEPMFREVM